MRRVNYEMRFDVTCGKYCLPHLVATVNKWTHITCNMGCKQCVLHVSKNKHSLSTTYFNELNNR